MNDSHIEYQMGLDQEDEYFNRKHFFELFYEGDRWGKIHYITTSEFDKLKGYTNYKKTTREELYKSLEDNVDHEEIKRRSNFNNTHQKENNQRNEDNRYLRSGF